MLNIIVQQDRQGNHFVVDYLMGMGVPYIPLRCTLSLVGCEQCYLRGDITISGILTLGTRWSVLVTLVTLKREISLGDFFEIRQSLIIIAYIA